MRITPLLLACTLSLSAFATDIAGKWDLTAKDPDGNDIKRPNGSQVRGRQAQRNHRQLRGNEPAQGGRVQRQRLHL